MNSYFYKNKPIVLEELNNVKKWIENTVKNNLDGRSKIKASELLNKYNNQSIKPLKNIDFYRALDILNYIRIPMNRTPYYINISYI